jgi:Leucine-rich repeat (LRR) protein
MSFSPVRHIFSLLLLLPFSLLSQQGPQDEMEKYGPFGTPVYTDLKTALSIERYVYRLDLKYQKLEPKQYEKMSKLTDLQALRLSGNEVNDYPKNFDALVNLVFFATYNNKFKNFPPNLKPFNNLQYLELQHTLIDSIPAQIAYLSKLRIFKFGNTDDTLRLPNTLHYLKNLKEVTIESCVMDSFPKELFKIPQLNYLNLYKTNTYFLSKHFERLPNLEILIIENNPISKIPFEIYKAQKLRFISLRNNKIEKLPDSISQLPELAFLDLRGNPMSTEEIEKLRALLPGCEIKF